MDRQERQAEGRQAGIPKGAKSVIGTQEHCAALTHQIGEKKDM